MLCVSVCVYEYVIVYDIDTSDIREKGNNVLWRQQQLTRTPTQQSSKLHPADDCARGRTASRNQARGAPTAVCDVLPGVIAPELVQLAACRQLGVPTIKWFALMADRRVSVRRRRRGCGAATAMAAASQRNFGRPHPLGDCRASRSLRPLLTSVPLYPWMSGAALADGKMIIWSCHTRGVVCVSEVHSHGR